MCFVPFVVNFVPEHGRAKAGIGDPAQHQSKAAGWPVREEA